MNDHFGLQTPHRPRADHIARANELQRKFQRMCEGLPYDARMLALTHALGVLNANAATTSDAARRNTESFRQMLLELVDRADADGVFEQLTGDELRTWDYGADALDLASVPGPRDYHRRAIWEVVHQLRPEEALTILLGIVMVVCPHAIPAEKRAEFFAGIGPMMMQEVANMDALANRTNAPNDQKLG